jgi:nicotinate-nucleotide pyrophosphorylase (carboxylating)
MNNINIIIDEIIINALKEDIGTGDITTNATIPADKKITGRFTAVYDGIICGLDICARVFEILDETIEFTAVKKDGEAVMAGDLIATVGGNARNVLTAERTALNLLMRMSGIATQTASTVAKIAESGTNAKIADTRKTTPGLRVLEKYAVKTGGGTNHRFNLADGILIKDNHIAAAGGITAAVKSARANAPHTLKIEVECENLKAVEEAVAANADIIMLDNMSNEEMRSAVEYINGRAANIITEASGNMGDKDLLEVAKTGVDIISIGALTHSVRSLDISLKFKLEE